MHVHSAASDAPVIAALAPLGCPESFTPPERVYEQARAAGMDLVTITDHDTIAGVLQLQERGFTGVVIGEEVTVHFPEDRCKLHVLLWGLTPSQHEQIGSLRLRDDVYVFAHWLAEQNLAHSLAHPLYVQNGRLTLWHLERASLLFKGFEVLNGAHTGLHRDTLQRWLNALTPGRVQQLIEKHGMEPLWSRIWVKALTAGSDDHAMLNIGRTWTSVEPPDDGDPVSPEAFLRSVMAGQSGVGGQAGHSALLAHQLMAVGFNYYTERLHDRLNPRGREFGAAVVRFAGLSPQRPRRASLALEAVRQRFGRRRGRALPIVDALRETLRPVLNRHGAVLDALQSPSGNPMAEHELMAAFTDDLADALVSTMGSDAFKRLRCMDRDGIVDNVLSYAAVAALQAPHLFSLFHQNKERAFLNQIDRQSAANPSDGTARPDNLRVMLFTDTLGDVNGVCRFIKNMGERAAASNRALQIVTSTRFELPPQDHITNFEPVFARTMPRYENLEIVLPPLMKMLRFADRFRPDAIHISTPGPVGVIGLLASKMLRVPIVGVYHTDFPAYIDHLFDDPTYTRITSEYMKLFYRSFSRIFSRSADYIDSLTQLGLERERMIRLIPGVVLDTFRPDYRDDDTWNDAPGVNRDSVKVLYCGRVSVEKNLPLLTEIWPRVREACAQSGRTAELIVVGDGPYREEMQRRLRSQGVHFLGFKHGEALSAVYASSDLFVFPSLTDTLGQVVLESQSSGLPVIVSDKGGPKEVVDQDITGFILSADRPQDWTDTMTKLICDDEMRSRMGRSAQTRAQRYSIDATFDQFWQAHCDAVNESRAVEAPAVQPDPSIDDARETATAD